MKTPESLLDQAEELDAEIFLIEETILRSPINKEDKRRLQSELFDKKASLANVNFYLNQIS